MKKSELLSILDSNNFIVSKSELFIKKVTWNIHIALIGN